MKFFSLTYVGLYVSLLGALLKLIGVEIATEELTEVVTTLLTFAGLLVAGVGRWKRGDVSVVGVKK